MFYFKYCSCDHVVSKFFKVFFWLYVFVGGLVDSYNFFDVKYNTHY